MPVSDIALGLTMIMFTPPFYSWFTGVFQMNEKIGPSVCIICVMLLAALFQVVEGRPRRDRDGSNAHNTQQESKVNRYSLFCLRDSFNQIFIWNMINIKSLVRIFNLLKTNQLDLWILTKLMKCYNNNTIINYNLSIYVYELLTQFVYRVPTKKVLLAPTTDY